MDTDFRCGNATEFGDAGRDPGKSFLFFLTSLTKAALKSDCLELGQYAWESTTFFVVSGAFLTALEKPKERVTFTPSRTHNRSRSPR